MRAILIIRIESRITFQFVPQPKEIKIQGLVISLLNMHYDIPCVLYPLTLNLLRYNDTFKPILNKHNKELRNMAPPIIIK